MACCCGCISPLVGVPLVAFLPAFSRRCGGRTRPFLGDALFLCACLGAPAAAGCAGLLPQAPAAAGSLRPLPRAACGAALRLLFPPSLLAVPSSSPSPGFDSRRPAEPAGQGCFSLSFSLFRVRFPAPRRAGWPGVFLFSSFLVVCVCACVPFVFAGPAGPFFGACALACRCLWPPLCLLFFRLSLAGVAGGLALSWACSSQECL